MKKINKLIVFLIIILIREARRRKKLTQEVESIEQEIKAYKK